MENKTNNKEENNDTVLVPGTAGNISPLPHTAPESGNRMYTLHDRIDGEDRDEEDDKENDKENDDEETHKTDWGDVDPQHNPMSPRSPMDPAAPGSAV